VTLRDIIGSFLPLDEGRRKVALGMFTLALLFVALMWGPGRGNAGTASDLIEALVWVAGLTIGGNAAEWIARRRAVPPATP